LADEEKGEGFVFSRTIDTFLREIFRGGGKVRRGLLTFVLQVRIVKLCPKNHGSVSLRYTARIFNGSYVSKQEKRSAKRAH